MIDKIQRLRVITEEQGFIGGAKAIIRFIKWNKSKIVTNIINFIFGWNFERKHGPGIDVMDQDWDNLIILDACRFDIFKKYTRFEGKLRKVVSHGHESWSFQFANFVDKELNDTIYITANPFSPKIEEGTFFKLVSLLDDWNVEVGATLPEIVTSRALNIIAGYPNKRVIVHYMQPHDPHIGDYEYEFEQEGRDGPNERKQGITVFEACRKGLITHSQLRESYIQNLKYVEYQVEELLRRLPGKTVITADHGENLGERIFGIRFYAHNNQTSQCRFVPWLELDYESRKEVIPSVPVGDVRPGGDTIDRRLKDLGYL